MSGSKDYFKAIHGKSFKNWTKKSRIPKTDESIDKLFKSIHTKYPLRSLGVGDKELLISEEEREANYHIIGQPRQGKSKFIEDNIRKDIDLGNGLCLLDPSDNGDTAKKILRYCAKKGVEKVLYIDPDTLVKYGKIATLKALKPYPYLDQSVDACVDNINHLFGVSKETETPRIRRNLSALLTVLARENLTLYETKYFRRYQHSKRLPYLGFDEDSMIIKDVFKSPFSFETYFLSTVNRLDVFRKEPLSLITGADTGIDFVKMVSEGWVILVNLYPKKSLTITQSRLLGIMIISEIIHAMEVLFHTPPEGEIKKIFYLYMDEAARFATPQIKDMLDYRGKIGLRLVIAHHHFEQFKDKDVLHAIKQGCRIKMMFNTSSYKDRLEMCEDLGYGGDIHPVLAAYVNQNIPKQEMVIKKDKETPVRLRVPDVPDIKLKDNLLEGYLNVILNQPWYLTRQQIKDQIDARFTPFLQKHTRPSQRRKVDDRQTNNPGSQPKPRGKGFLSNFEKPDKT